MWRIFVSWPAAFNAPDRYATPMLSPIGQSKFGQMNWTFIRVDLLTDLKLPECAAP